MGDVSAYTVGFWAKARAARHWGLLVNWGNAFSGAHRAGRIAHLKRLQAH